MNPYPLLFRPLLKPRVWGGRSLEQFGKLLPPHQNIGESWELADLPDSIPDGRSIIANGELAGRTLRHAIVTHRDQIMGDAKLSAEGGFPLLIKYLDARENLSVQVHPTPEYTANHPGSHVKSEAWVIIAAGPGAVIYKGIKTGVTAEQFAMHIKSGEVVNDLISVPARVGDCHYLPSGVCHALGAGVVVAEVQTPSDTTFRVFDWNRPATAGRELHVEQALRCIDFTHSQPDKPHKRHKPMVVNGVRTTGIVETDFFTIERLDAEDRVSFRVVTSGMPEVWMMLAGSGKIQTTGGENADLLKGTTVLIPAELLDATAHLERGAWLLRIKLPSRMKGMLA